MASIAKKGSDQDSLRDLSTWTPELSRALLAWWEKHGRRDPEQKPWMFTTDQTWPLPAEVMLHFQHTAHGFWGDALNPRYAYRFDSSARNRIKPWSG